MNWQKISWLFLLIVSFSTLSHAQKSYKDKQLLGVWMIYSVGGEKMPEDVEMTLTFTKSGSIIMESPEGQEKASWKLSRKGYFIEVESPDGPEEWEIKELSKSKLILKDRADEIVLIRKGKSPKPTKKRVNKIKNPSKYLIGSWKVISFNGEDMSSENMLLAIEEQGKIQLSYNGTVSQAGNWKLNSNEDGIVVTEEDESPEEWKIIYLDKENLELLDKSLEIILIKK